MVIISTVKIVIYNSAKNVYLACVGDCELKCPLLAFCATLWQSVFRQCVHKRKNFANKSGVHLDFCCCLQKRVIYYKVLLPDNEFCHLKGVNKQPYLDIGTCALRLTKRCLFSCYSLQYQEQSKNNTTTITSSCLFI